MGTLILSARALLLILLLPALCGAQQRVDLVIENVTVIDPASKQVLPGHDVFIADGRISGIEPHGGPVAFKAADRLAGKNRFLIPGLLDMHVHLTLSDAVEMESSLDLMLANGVTGVRDMASDCWEPREESSLCLDDMRKIAEEVRSEQRKGQRTGPRLLALSSAIVRGEMERGYLPKGAKPFFAPETAEEGKELARYLDQRGVDLVKIYNTVPREAYFALLEEARRHDLEVSGHLPLGVSVLEASKAGHRTLEHARDLPVACSSYGPSYRQTMHEVVAREAHAEPPDAETRLRRTLEGFDEELCLDVVRTLAKSGTYLVPTHGTREMDARAAEKGYRQDRRLRFITALRLEDWQEDLGHTAEVAPLLSELYQEFYDLGLRTTGLAHQAGVKIMAATDANDTMIFPGFGLHDELERLAQAGLEPMEILRAATTVPAEYLGRSEDLGEVAAGKLADLVLLERNPLENIRNTTRIRAVILGGRVHRRADLDAMLRRVATEARQSKKTP